MGNMEINEQTIIVDSREKWTQDGSHDKHISSYFKRHGVRYVVKKLDVGDYMTFGGTVSVDRKHSIDEITKNLTNPADKKRFMAEVRRAYQLHIRLVVLIESNEYRDVYDLRRWKSEWSPVNGSVLIKQMERISFAYGVMFAFSPRQSVARRICEILGVPIKEPPRPKKRKDDVRDQDQNR